MADVNVVNYRYNPFLNALEPIAITGETHVIPTNSPFTIRLAEVPLKESPSTVSLTIGGVAGVEVAADPAAGEFRCDYTTGADNDENWNTGLIQFNAADAGKTVVAAYNGTGTLVDKRTIDAINAKINGTVSITGGTVANGGTIPLPSGYTRAQCKYAVWAHSQPKAYGTYRGQETRTVNQDTGAVTCTISSDDEDTIHTQPGTAGYLCIGVK